MMTFMQYMEMRATAGRWLTKIAPGTPHRKSRPLAPPKPKPMSATTTTKPVANASGLGPAGAEGLKRLGIDLLPPRQDELENLVEKDKRRPPRRLGQFARIA